MKAKLMISAFLGMAAWSVSNISLAGWDEGPCPQPHTGPAPCIEVLDNNDVYWHFNGDGSHADIWHGAPPAGANDLSFSGPSDLDCGDLGANCTLTLNGQVKKCQDSNGDWRIGVKVNSSSIGGGGLCSFIGLGGFPWYTGSIDLPHCPFEDDCDNFIPYTPSPNTLTGTVGSIDITLLGIPRVTGGHVHGVIFTPGCNPTFTFNSDFYDCDEESEGCSVNGVLTATNIQCLNIY